MLRLIAIAALWAAVLPAGGCVPSSEGHLDGERLFVPLLGFEQAYLRLDLKNQTGSGGLLVKFLDFAGKRVALEIIPLPSPKSLWGAILGHGSEKNGRKYYCLKIERFGDPGPPLKYSFQPVAGVKAGPLGLFEPEP